MPFAYYRRLTRKQQALYRDSDRVHALRLSSPAALQPAVHALQAALDIGIPDVVEPAAQALLDGITQQIDAPALRVMVLTVRPHDEESELHGLYKPAAGRRPAQIAVWMHTARRQHVVAFRTFLRTLLHELCHHLDYELLGLEESFHTEGFYKRESSLFHQLVPERSRGAIPAPKTNGMI